MFCQNLSNNSVHFPNISLFSNIMFLLSFWELYTMHSEHIHFAILPSLPPTPVAPQ